MKLFLIAFLCAFAAFPVRAETPPRFFETLYDVPVMPGLQELPEKALVFDKPSGRIAQAGAAARDVPEQAIKAFYAAALPQLGWAPAGADSWRRDGEKLVFSYARQGPYGVVQLTLSPMD